MLRRWLAWLEPMELLWAGSEARAQHLLSCCHSLAWLPELSVLSTLQPGTPSSAPLLWHCKDRQNPPVWHSCHLAFTAWADARAGLFGVGVNMNSGCVPGLGFWPLSDGFRQLTLPIVLDWQKVEMIVSVDRELGTMWVYKQKQTVALQIKMFLLLACIQ